MKRTLKWIFGILGALIVVVAAAAVIAVMNLDPSVYKSRIEEAVETHTGRRLNLKGDISVTLFPWIGVELGSFTLSNPPGFGSGPFVKVDKAGVQIKLMPLLGGDVLVKGVELSGLEVELIRKPSGTTNWDDLAGKGETEVTDEPASEPAKEGDDFIKSLFVGEVAVKNARVLWDDRRSNQRYEIRQLNLTTGALTPGEPFDATLSMNFNARNPDLKGSLDLAARIFIDQVKEQFKAQGLRLGLKAEGGALPFKTADVQLAGDATYGRDRIKVSALTLGLKAQGGQLKNGGTLSADLSGDADMDLKTQKAAVKDFKLKGELDSADPALKAAFDMAAQVRADIRRSTATLDGLTLAADAAGASLGLDKSRVELSADADFNWEMLVLNLKKLALSASAEGKSIPGKSTTAELKTDLTLGLKDENLSVQRMSLKAMGVNLSGSIRGTSVMSKPNLSGNLKAKPFNLRTLLAGLGTKPDMRDPTALTDVSLSTGFSASADAVSLRSINLGLDGSKLQGDLAVKGFKRPIPALSFKLKGDSLDADRYLPPESSGGGEKSSGSAESGSKDEAIIPVQTLRDLQVDGTLSLGRFKINNLRMNNVNVNVRASGGKVDVRPLKLSMYEGALNAALSLDASRATPHSSVSLDLGTINLRPFLHDLTGKEGMGGHLAVKTVLDTSGAKLRDILSGLSGNFAMNLKDCDIDKAGKFDNSVLLPLQAIGTSLEPLIKALAAMQTLNLGNSLPRLGGSEEKLASVVMDASAKRGMVNFKTLEVLYPYLRINGNGGTMNLHDMTLNYPFTAKIVGSGKGQSADLKKETGGMTIPVNCRGSLQSPTCVPDPASIIKGVLSQPIDSPEDLLENLGSAFGIGGKKKTEETEKAATTEKQTAPAEKKQAPEPVKQMENLLKGFFN